MRYFKKLDSDDIIGISAIALFIFFVLSIIYFAITSQPTKEPYYKTIKRIVYKIEVTGKYNNRKSILYEDGSKDSFSNGDEGFFLNIGDTVIYTDRKTPWLSVENIIFK